MTEPKVNVTGINDMLVIWDPSNIANASVSANVTCKPEDDHANVTCECKASGYVGNNISFVY